MKPGKNAANAGVLGACPDLVFIIQRGAEDGGPVFMMAADPAQVLQTQAERAAAMAAEAPKIRIDKI
ncbi:MAG: hypothetical protein ACOYNN_15140 [Terrimicrobiaceae bacterium]